jgi:hypothetical protein
MCQNPQVVFLSRKQIVQHAIPSLVAKTMEQSIILTLDSRITTIIFFDLWMFRFEHDTFVFVINFINSLWVPYHVTMGLFEAISICLKLQWQHRSRISNHHTIYYTN